MADGSAARADLREFADVRRSAAAVGVATRKVCTGLRAAGFFDSSAWVAHFAATTAAAAGCGSICCAALCDVGCAAERHGAVRPLPPRTAAPRAGFAARRRWGGPAEAQPPRQTRESSPPARVKWGRGGPRNARAHLSSAFEPHAPEAALGSRVAAPCCWR
ncbi:hypothetical protein FGB62_119g07 [Gracilaria domingensis]|nr:hypothetical protein FGB62_119g07 [Gracilaria domingensis]